MLFYLDSTRQIPQNKNCPPPLASNPKVTAISLGRVRMRKCGICCQERATFMMNNKFVCTTCDDLLFDIELELDEMETSGKESKDQVVKRPNKTPHTPFSS